MIQILKGLFCRLWPIPVETLNNFIDFILPFRVFGAQIIQFPLCRFQLGFIVINLLLIMRIERTFYSIFNCNCIVDVNCFGMCLTNQ